MDHTNHFGLESIKLSAILIGIGLSAMVVAIYHCLVMKWCLTRRHHSDGQSPTSQHHHSSRHEMEMVVGLGSVENSTANLIPAHKYKKGKVVAEDEEMCPVCLSQFEEGEELRTLPECLHSYHAPCIDMWFYSHSSCPMCRTDANPFPLPSLQPEIAHHRLDSGRLHLDSGMVVLVHPGH